MNSCGSVHGVVMHDNSFGVHLDSRGASGHRNSCNSHAAEIRGETKALSTGTRCKVGRPAGKELAPLQQAPEKLDVETGSWPEDFVGAGNRSWVCFYGGLSFMSCVTWTRPSF